MQTLDPNNPDDQWYYDIEVRLVSGAVTDVEYVWKYYRDRNDNKFLVDRPTENDGYIGCVGDQDPIDNSVIDIDTQTLSRHCGPVEIRNGSTGPSTGSRS